MASHLWRRSLSFQMFYEVGFCIRVKKLSFINLFCRSLLRIILSTLKMLLPLNKGTDTKRTYRTSPIYNRASFLKRQYFRYLFGGARFESRRDTCFPERFVVGFVSPSRRMPGWYNNRQWPLCSTSFPVHFSLSTPSMQSSASLWQRR